MRADAIEKDIIAAAAGSLEVEFHPQVFVGPIKNKPGTSVAAHPGDGEKPILDLIKTSRF